MREIGRAATRPAISAVLPRDLPRPSARADDKLLATGKPTCCSSPARTSAAFRVPLRQPYGKIGFYSMPGGGKGRGARSARARRRCRVVAHPRTKSRLSPPALCPYFNRLRQRTLPDASGWTACADEAVAARRQASARGQRESRARQRRPRGASCGKPAPATKARNECAGEEAPARKSPDGGQNERRRRGLPWPKPPGPPPRRVHEAARGAQVLPACPNRHGFLAPARLTRRDRRLRARLRPPGRLAQQRERVVDVVHHRDDQQLRRRGETPITRSPRRAEAGSVRADRDGSMPSPIATVVITIGARACGSRRKGSSVLAVGRAREDHLVISRRSACRIHQHYDPISDFISALSA